MKYELYRVTPADGNDHYAFFADDNEKQAMLDIQANGAPTRWAWSCEAATVNDAIQALDDLLEENDWKV
jgi:hypothetical protein